MGIVWNFPCRASLIFKPKRSHQLFVSAQQDRHLSCLALKMADHAEDDSLESVSDLLEMLNPTSEGATSNTREQNPTSEAAHYSSIDNDAAGSNNLDELSCDSFDSDDDDVVDYSELKRGISLEDELENAKGDAPSIEE